MIGYINQYKSINPDKYYAFTRNGKNLHIGTSLYRFLLTKQTIHMVLYRKGSATLNHSTTLIRSSINDIKAFNNLNMVFD